MSLGLHKVKCFIEPKSVMKALTKTFLLLLLPLGISQAAIIEIQGFADRSTVGGDFVDIGDGSGGTVTGTSFGDSAVTSGDFTLTFLGDVASGTAIETSSGDSSGNSYEVGSEVNLKNFDASDFSSAVSNDSFIEIKLESSGSNFSLDSISVSLWRNGGSAPSDYQFGETDGTALGSSQSFGDGGVGDAGTITASSLSSTFNNVSTATVRLYAWGGSSNGNTHFYNVEADYSPVPEPGNFALISALFLGAVAVARRRR